MARKNLPPSAFALPGLAKDSRKPFGLHNQRDGYSFSGTTNLPQKHGSNATNDQLDDSLSLVDDQGVFLAPQTSHTLEHLTKTRPRSPGRRSPSPFRKFDSSDNLSGHSDVLNNSLELENPEKWMRDDRDYKSDRIKSLDERSLSPTLILTNDVGLSVSSSALPKPSPIKRNLGNHSEVFSTSDKLRSRENGEVNVSVEKQTGNAIRPGRGDIIPPPVPLHPPPQLEDDFVPHVYNKLLREEVEHSSQPSKTVVRMNRYDLPAKLDSTSTSSRRPNGAYRTDEFMRNKQSDSTSSDKRKYINNSLSRTANAQELGRTFSEDSDSGLTGLPRIGSGILDKQVSLDSGISSLPSQSVTPWRTSSRQRNPVEKSPSARRRRFKPVTLSDESELKDSDNPVGNHDTFNSTGTVSDHNSSARLRGTQFETSAFGPLHRGPEKRRENQDLGYGVHKSEFITDEKLRKVDNAVQEASQVMEISDRSALSSKAGSTVKNDRQSPVWSDVNDMSRTTNPEPTVVFEYDDASNVKKVEENDSDERFTSDSLDLRTPHTIESKEEKVMTNGTLDDTSTVSKSDVTQHRKSPITLPKVVIEYDGVVISDPIIDGYDAEDSSSDDKTSLLSYSSVNDQYVLSNRNMEQDSDASHSSDDGDYFNSNGTLLVDEEDMNLEEEDHTFVESAEEEIELEAPQGIEYLDQIEDGLMYQPARAITEVSHVHEADEMVFQPPPMFASFGEEGEEEDEEEQEDEVEENGYDIRSFSPAIPPLLLEEQPRDDRLFHNLALEAWTEEDCVEWLDFIGLAHFTEEFREHHVDGRMLKNVNFQLLEEIGIQSPDEREVILSEIYRRFHPEEEDMFEMEVQGALESASEQEKMKIMAVLNALRSPAFQAELGVASSTGSSSPHDSDAGFQVASETVSLSSSMTGSDDHPRDDAMPPPPPPPTWTQSVQKSEVNHSEWERSENQETISQEDERPRKTTKGKEKSIEKERKSGKHGHKHKKHKGVSKLLDSLSLGSGSSKLTKLFHSSASSKKLNPAMQYLLQAGPQGLVRIWPMALSQETNYCSFLVSMTTTCSEVVKLVFEKYDVVEDARRFYICEVHLGKGGAHHDLTDVDCPLLYQCRWSDPEKYRFELRSRNEGVIKMLFELEEYDDDLDYRSVALSMKTPCSEALSLIVKKFSLPGDTRDYYLVEVSEENEDDREEVADHVYPLRLQRAWSAPDHVFRLCRRVTVVKDDSKQDGWIVPEATEDISQEPSNYLQSESSSVRDEDELDSAADMDGVEEDEVVEDTTQELMEGFRELDSEDQSAVDETERAAIEELRRAKRELLSKDVELQELRLKSSALLEKEREIESLKRENEALRRGGEEFGELAAISKKLAESERGFERVRVENEELRKATSELEEKSIHEISMRDREIERLYSRNNELCSKEKELESLRKKSEGFDTQGQELEKLRLLQHESSLSRTELVTKLDELQTRHDEMLVNVSHVEELKRINRELCEKVDEGEIVRQELERSEADRRELKRKLEELERKRKEFEEVYNGVESLRSENRQLSAQSKDAEEMKKNIIKLSAQLRDMERHDEVAHLQKKLEQSDAEKQQLSEKVAELQKREGTARENTKKVEDLKLENIFLVERTKEVDELKTTVAKLTGEVRENESFRQKYKELRDVESYLTKQTSTLENVVRQKDQRLKESEKKVKSLTESVKDMEAKLEEQEQNRTYLDQLLSMLKDRDPALLHLMNTSLASSEPEEWC